MQRFVLCLLVLILAAAPVWAARNPIQPINKSPYVSALVIDADTGNVLFEDNADARVYPASVLKLMDLYVLLDRIDQGLLKLDEMVPVTAEAYKTGGSQVYLDPKEQFSFFNRQTFMDNILTDPIIAHKQTFVKYPPKNQAP